ncbi:MAG: 50S ribosomal protein L18Ae [Candidatus Bathyarchaeota archaeon BA1]|nr:MAG: 50S ribosomal protein L18Ae [Candidatus Bathyarchaeota archaeon BA1]
MSEVKVFRVMGELRKPNYQSKFTKEVAALKPEQAIEMIYTNIGSKHRAKRYQIKIDKVEEISPERIESPTIRKLTLTEEETRS